MRNDYYDIHANSETEGEIISYSKDAQKTIPYDSVIFLKYFLKNSSNGDNRKNLYTITDEVSKTSGWNADCIFYVSDGLIAFKQNTDDERMHHLTKLSSTNAFNVSDLKDGYMAYYDDHTLFPPEGYVWMPCVSCGGSGEVVSYETVTDGYNAAGYPRYTDKRKNFHL